MFDATLAKRPQVVAINKVDLPQVASRVEALKAVFREAGIIPVFISAAAGSGLKELVEETWKLLQEAEIKEKAELHLAEPPRVFHPKPVDQGVKVRKKGNTFIISDPALERLLDKVDPEDPNNLQELNEAMEKLGVNKTLRSAGAKSGDTVITGKMEWTWTDDEDRRHGRNV